MELTDETLAEAEEIKKTFVADRTRVADGLREQMRRAALEASVDRAIRLAMVESMEPMIQEAASNAVLVRMVAMRMAVMQSQERPPTLAQRAKAWIKRRL